MKRLKVVFSIIIAVALMPWATLSIKAASNASLGSTGYITVTLEAGDYEIDQIDKYCVIQMEGFGSIINPREPKLPSKTFLIGLPPGAEAVSVEMVAKNYQEIPGEYRIMPAPPIISGQENEKVKWEENEEIYSSENAYPPSVYEYLGMGQMRKYNFARVRFCPIVYYPASNKLGLYQSITLKIKYEISQLVPSELLSDTVMDDIASEIIFNYSSMKSQYLSAAAPSSISYNYVIITTDSLQSAVEPLVTWKTTIGYLVNVVTTSWISLNYSGIDLPEKIRNFLIDKYAEWGIKYVLIVGSHTTIPMRYCYPHSSDHDPDSSSTTPTDYYYADLNGDWDSDGDGYFGEYGQDSIGYHPEVYVGRIPFDNITTVSSICQKMVNFEQDSGTWKKKALLLAAIANYAGEDHEFLFPRTDAAVLMEECWKDILKDNGYSRERMYEKEGLSPSNYVCDHPLTNSNVLNPSYGWPSGYGIVNWGAHGGSSSVYRKVWAWDDGDGVPEGDEIDWYGFISSSDASSLDDSKSAIVFSKSCWTARPEDANNLGNSLLQHGAVAFVGATRPSWYAVGWSNENSGATSSIDYYFFHYLVNQDQKCGDALYNAQVRVYDHYWFPDWRDWQNMFDFCLYGEPSLGTTTVPVPPDISVQPASFDVTLTPDTIYNDTMEIGNEGGATLYYGIAEAVPHELIYDDGTVEMGHAYWYAGCGHAVRFTPPSYPVTLDTARICLYNSSHEEHFTFAVEVYDDDGPGGAPGTQLGTTVQTTPSHGSWWDVDISALGIFITDGDFYILEKQLSDLPDCELICRDCNGPIYGRSWSYDGGEWELWEYDNLMIRCVVEVPEDCPWLDESPKLGLVEPGNSDSVTISANAVGLALGDYEAKLVVTSNDPSDSPITVPVSLLVNNAPNTPTNPSPANHVTDVSVNANLSWVGGDPDVGDTVSYDVFFGTSPVIPCVSYDQIATSYDPGTLNYDTTYYWKIDATDNHGVSTQGTLWDFTTEYNPPIPDDLNPHFMADKTVVEVGETVTFYNLTTGGMHPYIQATWDFDADSVAETVYEHPAGVGVMADVTWAYDTPGIYSVELTMTDSTPTTRWDTKLDYITVIGEVVVSIDTTVVVTPESDFTADVAIVNVANLDAAQYDVVFDDTVFRLDDVNDGNIGGTAIPVDIWNLVDGRVMIVQNVPGLDGVTGDGTLAELQFHVIGSGGYESNIDLQNGLLGDNTGVAIEADWIDGEVLVVGVFVPGDANGDGVVNNLDITKVERIIVGLDAETPGADANQDGVVNNLDITKVERIIVGLD